MAINESQIDFNILNHSIFYYKLKKYEYIEVPWLVDEDISNLTKPDNKKNFYVNDKTIVASAEQSFLQLIKENKLEYGNYITTTPCFRDEIVDDLHNQYFMKTELMIFNTSDNLLSIFHDVLNMCLSFFNQYIDAKILHTLSNTYYQHDISYTDILNIVSNNNDKLDQKIYEFDIVINIDQLNIELGSYGIRSRSINNKTISWIYATGCAEPRLSNAIKKNKNIGYHSTIIPKNNIGTFLKILEEYEEVKDALLNNNKIMELVELSDLIGAIELYISTNYNLSLNDLDIMNKTTQRAFKNGRR